MKKTAFTLMEILLAMSIIGVLAVATMNNIGKIQSNKTKEAFRNCYNHMEQTVSSIISDESVYPKVNWGTTLDSTGNIRRYPIRMFDLNENTGEGSFSTGATTNLFSRTFMNRSSTTETSISGKYYRFYAKNGSYWVVYYNSSQSTGKKTNISDADYIIIFDVNGRNNGNDCPYSGENLTTGPTNCTKPDTFKFGLTYDNRIITDNNSVYNGKTLGKFMAEYGYGEEAAAAIPNLSS